MASTRSDQELDFENDQLLLPSYISADDINQEIELLRLRGIDTPNRKFVRLRLKAASPELHFGIPSANIESSYIPGAEPEPNPTAIQRLLEAAALYPEMADDIYHFLADPSDAYFYRCLRVARRLGILNDRRPRSTSDEVHTHTKPSSVSAMILDLLASRGAASRETIIEEVAPSHVSRRPAAAVRTALRRLCSEGQVYFSNGLYSVATSN